MTNLPPPSQAVPARQPAYGWVIVAASALMIMVTYGLVYSYSVFFKPLVEHFAWDRATVSMIYSLAVIIRGAIAIGAGWLSDKYGPRKIMVACSILMGAGYLLSSQVTTLWQFFLTYAVIEAAGMSGIFSIGTALVSSWFTRNRGLVLGIAASGSGLGTFFIVPGVERLIDTYDWSQTFIIIGITAGAIMIIGSLFLRRAPEPIPVPNMTNGVPSASGSTTVSQALKNPLLYLTMLTFFVFFFGIQMVMVHLVNYATDSGITPSTAAWFVSIIGIVSIAGRLSTGIIADRLGMYWGLVITCLFMIVSFVILLLAQAPWTFYLFAVLFGIPYGGEVTQIPLVIGRYFGTRSMATLMGITLFIIGLGGALGPWTAGKIYDVTGSYTIAFIIGTVLAVASMIMVGVMKRVEQTQPRAS